MIIPFAFGGFLVWYSFSGIDFNKFTADLKNANHWWIGLSLSFGILSHISRAYRWSFMLEPMGYTPRLTNNILAVLVGYLVNYTIPRAGEASRALVLTNYEGISFEKSFGTIVAERVADLLMLVVVVIVTLFLQFDFILGLLTPRLCPPCLAVSDALILRSGRGFLTPFKTGFRFKYSLFGG